MLAASLSLRHNLVFKALLALIVGTIQIGPPSHNAKTYLPQAPLTPPQPSVEC